ncbi:MAG TPA: hypothetical protein VFP93_02280, partial [Gammaproteobacteria bacterium]|nr:hypothetical protein [Gammaproteobacteria bacterium]
SVLQMEGEVNEVEAKIDAWMLHHKVLVDRFKQLVSDLKAQPSRTFTMYSVALRELLDLSQASQVSILSGKYN